MALTYEQYKGMALKSSAQLTHKATDTKGLAEGLGLELKHMGFAEEQYDVSKNLEIKSQSFRETKANEIMHTTNTGYGAELVPGSILLTDFIDMAPKASALLQFFQAGYHGKNLDKTMDVPIIGELPLHLVRNEQTTGALAFAQGVGREPTAKVTINQVQRYFTVDISDQELRFAGIGGSIDVLAIVKQKLAASAANTIVSDFLNGDTVLTANTNINSIDGTPAGTESYTVADGLRKIAFSGSTSYDLGTLAFADYITLLAALGNNGITEDMAYIHSLGARNAALTIDEFSKAYINGVNSSAITGIVPNIMGANIYVDRWLKASNTAGKVATGTPANNTKGSILAVHKTAVQHGSNGEYLIEIYRVPGVGIQVIGYYYYGHAVQSAKAGTDPTVALGFNIS